MSVEPRASVVWLRDDLRLADNPALRAAVDTGNPVVVVFVLDDESEGIRPIGGASRWWLHHSLDALGADLAAHGTPLILRRGPAREVIAALLAEVDAGSVFWNRRYGGVEREIDAAVKADARGNGLDAHSFQGSLLYEPWTVRTGSDGPYTVFTPFWRSCQKKQPPRDPVAKPRTIVGPEHPVASDDLDSWGLLPTRPDWAGGLRERWTPGEAGGHARLTSFVSDIGDYAGHRDEPAWDATSNLSPHLRWGEVSPFQVWHAVEHARRSDPAVARGEDAAKFLAELGWREFCANLLFHWPDLATENFDSRFDGFPWNEPSAETLEAWRHGRTGIPLVDAGMRELWQTGYMHNRVRMVTASFLIKNLLVDWRTGEQWFWDTLVDADAASNAANWQWVAGSGADASPYFRVFNPVTQSTKFDAAAEYVKEYVPELRGFDAKTVHEPWKHTPDLLDDVSEEDGADGADPAGAYPSPLVDLGDSRKRALDAFDVVKNTPRHIRPPVPGP